jgi:hypothetical protein
MARSEQERRGNALSGCFSALILDFHRNFQSLCKDAPWLLCQNYHRRRVNRALRSSSKPA